MKICQVWALTDYAIIHVYPLFYWSYLVLSINNLLLLAYRLQTRLITLFSKTAFPPCAVQPAPPKAILPCVLNDCSRWVNCLDKENSINFAKRTLRFSALYLNTNDDNVMSSPLSFETDANRLFLPDLETRILSFLYCCAQAKSTLSTLYICWRIKLHKPAWLNQTTIFVYVVWIILVLKWSMQQVTKTQRILL